MCWRSPPPQVICWARCAPANARRRSSCTPAASARTPRRRRARPRPGSRRCARNATRLTIHAARLTAETRQAIEKETDAEVAAAFEQALHDPYPVLP